MKLATALIALSLPAHASVVQWNPVEEREEISPAQIIAFAPKGCKLVRVFKDGSNIDRIEHQYDCSPPSDEAPIFAAAYLSADLSGEVKARAPTSAALQLATKNASAFTSTFVTTTTHENDCCCDEYPPLVQPQPVPIPAMGLGYAMLLLGLAWFYPGRTRDDK